MRTGLQIIDILEDSLFMPFFFTFSSEKYVLVKIFDITSSHGIRNYILEKILTYYKKM